MRPRSRDSSVLTPYALRLRSRPPLTQELTVLFRSYLENRRRNIIQKKYGGKRRLPRTHVSFSGL